MNARRAEEGETGSEKRGQELTEPQGTLMTIILVPEKGVSKA